MVGCLWTRVRKQPIIALYFEFRTVLKFYNLGPDLILYPPCLTLKAWYQIILAPTAASLPIVQDKNEAKTKTAKVAVLNHPFRILIMNCQSIKNKKAGLHTIIDSAKPDIILRNESWL